MILYQEKETIIRTIEPRDKEEILKMFKKENFGMIGLLADQRPSIVEEMKIIDQVLSKEALSEEYIILEQNGIIVTYANVYQELKDRLHIGTIITKEEYRNHGYCSTLLQFIKDYSDQNNLTVRTESLTCRDFLLRMGFSKEIRNIDFIYKPKMINQKINKYPIFLDYEGQTKINQEHEKKDLENYSKTLDFLKSIGF